MTFFIDHRSPHSSKGAALLSLVLLLAAFVGMLTGSLSFLARRQVAVIHAEKARRQGLQQVDKALAAQFISHAQLQTADADTQIITEVALIPQSQTALRTVRATLRNERLHVSKELYFLEHIVPGLLLPHWSRLLAEQGTDKVVLHTQKNSSVNYQVPRTESGTSYLIATEGLTLKRLSMEEPRLLRAALLALGDIKIDSLVLGPATTGSLLLYSAAGDISIEAVEGIADLCQSEVVTEAVRLSLRAAGELTIAGRSLPSGSGCAEHLEPKYWRQTKLLGFSSR